MIKDWKNISNIANENIQKIQGEQINYNGDIHKSNIVFYELGYIIYYLIITFGIIFAIINLGIQTTTILTIFSTFGLAIGLVLQGVLTNITSGIYIGFNDLFKIGDVINIDGYTGMVDSFSLFNTILKTNSGSKIIIPNNKFQSNIMINYTM